MSSATVAKPKQKPHSLSIRLIHNLMFKSPFINWFSLLNMWIWAVHSFGKLMFGCSRTFKGVESRFMSQAALISVLFSDFSVKFVVIDSIARVHVCTLQTINSFLNNETKAYLIICVLSLPPRNDFYVHTPKLFIFSCFLFLYYFIFHYYYYF